MLNTLSAAIILMFGMNAFAANYIVKQKSGSLSTLSNMVGIQVVDQHAKVGLAKINVDEKKITKKQEALILKNLMQNPSVEYVVEDFKLNALRAPVTVSQLKEQWAIAKIGAQRAWDLAGNKGEKSVTVAVIDTGVDYRHESLRTNMVSGYDYRDNDSDPMDETGSSNPGHGTHCAGIIGANGIVDGGTIGIAPNISIMPIRFLGADGSGDLMNGIKAIDYAIEKGVQVISASWGAAVPTAQAQPLIEAVQRASDAGVIFVAAAANDGKNNDTRSMYPANAEFANTIAVAASGPQDEKPQWSNYGKAKVHLASPGLNIMSTLPSNKYGNLSGTSMATPLVAGLVALLKSQDSSLSGQQIRSLLQTTGAKVEIETACHCRIDAGEAMAALTEKRMFVAPATKTLALNGTQSFEAVNGQGNLTYSVSNPQVASISSAGVLTASAEGETTVTITDAQGHSASSLAIYIGQQQSDGGGGNGACPFDNPALCQILCGIMPDAEWCK